MTAKKYSEEFKLETIKLYKSSGKTIAEIERELGLSHSLLRHWVKRYDVDEDNERLVLTEVEQLKQELMQAKKDLARAQMERDILKKTIGIFSDGQSK